MNTFITFKVELKASDGKIFKNLVSSFSYGKYTGEGMTF